MSDDLQHKMARIAQAVATGQYRYTVHGAQQRIARGIHRGEIEAAIAGGEIIGSRPGPTPEAAAPLDGMAWD